MKFVVLTIFPEIFPPFWQQGIMRRAIEGQHVTVRTLNLRDFTDDHHRTTDDRPYGGGCGMVMTPQPLARAIQSAQQAAPGAWRILLSPQGQPLTQALAAELATLTGLILICGRYEGVDERIGDHYCDLELSIGDYVLTGGELPAMVLMDAVMRLLPGVLGGAQSAARDSFSDRLLEHAHYTRPPVFEQEAVPQVLLSGHHLQIEQWRREMALMRTLLKRPDLLTEHTWQPEDLNVFRKWHARLEDLLNAAARASQ